jgi:hypothetical protein
MVKVSVSVPREDRSSHGLASPIVDDVQTSFGAHELPIRRRKSALSVVSISALPLPAGGDVSCIDEAGIDVVDTTGFVSRFIFLRVKGFCSGHVV